MKKKWCLVAMLCVLLVLMGIVLAACSGVTIEQDPDTGLVTVRGAKSASSGEGGRTSQNPSGTTPTRYNVTLTLSNSAAGTVTGAGAYESGAYVTVTATANEGFNFLGWYRDGAEMSTETSYTFPMPEAASVKTETPLRSIFCRITKGSPEEARFAASPGSMPRQGQTSEASTTGSSPPSAGSCLPQKQ